MNSDAIKAVALRFRVPVPPGSSEHGAYDAVRTFCAADEEAFLDVIDGLLHLMDGREARALDDYLGIGGSVWTVAPDGCSLRRRVEPSAQAALNQAVSPDDAASNELAEAWSKVYGRHPDPSDAWDHAIKALEAVLKPIVVPKKESGTLGDVVGQLKGQPHLWQLGLQSNGLGGVETLEAMLRLIWPNPDRHSASNSRGPTQSEAEAVVHLSVTIVQWCRSGLLVRK